MLNRTTLWVITASALLILIPLGFTGSAFTFDRSDDVIPAEESSFEAGDSLELIKFRSELSAAIDLTPWRLILATLCSAVMVAPACAQRMPVSFLFCRPPPLSL